MRRRTTAVSIREGFRRLGTRMPRTTSRVGVCSCRRHSSSLVRSLRRVERDLEQPRPPERSADGDHAVLYSELRHLAASMLSRERRDHTLQPTALVHEAYLKLSRQDPGRWSDKNHYLALAAMAMRRILADHGRAQKAAKRGGGVHPVQVDRVDPAADSPDDQADPVAVAELLDELERLNARHARLVELRFYAGMTMPQAADVMGISLPTAERDWRMARAWLRSRLEA